MQRVRTAIKIAIILGWSALVVLELRAFMPDNPLRVTKNVKTTLTFFAPQGWVFFTRSPREANDRVYGRTSPCCELLTLPNGAAANLFGLKRDARSFGIEMAPLLTAIRRDAWLECRGSLADCVSRLKVPPATVANASATRMACGQIVIQRQQPIPWAWSGNRNIRPPYALASLNVSCK